MNKKIITLLSDSCYSDYYIAAIKAILLSKIDNLSIIDISHGIKKHNIEDAAFTLKNAYSFFPDGTIHIICINTEASNKSPHILVKTHNQYFIAADNGILSLIFNNTEAEIYEIDYMQTSPHFTFSEKDVFAEIAILIANDADYSKHIIKIDNFNTIVHGMQTLVDSNRLIGFIQHIDTYSNAITTITQEQFRNFVKNSKFRVKVGGRTQIYTIGEAYSDQPEGEIVVLFGSHGYMEIAINKGKASELLGINRNTNVIIELI